VTKQTNERLGAVNEKLSPLQVTRHAVEVLRRLTASAANESLRPTEAEMEACATAVWRLPEHYRRWHIEVFDKARELLITAAELPVVALVVVDHVERSGREMAALAVARASTESTSQLDEAWRTMRENLTHLDGEFAEALCADADSFEETLQISLLSDEQRGIATAISNAHRWLVGSATEYAEQFERDLAAPESTNAPG
jgi:muconolactone delta-isomerase